MNHPSLFTRVQFQALLLIPFTLCILHFAIFSGCGQKEEPKVQKPDITLENLQTAYAKAFRHVEMYKLFLAQAEKERNANAAALYRAVIASETIHANAHAELMKKRGVQPAEVNVDPVKVGTVIQTLKMATSSEEIEAESMFPNLLRTAMAENFTEAAEQFGRCRDGDSRQLELLKDAYERGGKIQKVTYTICPTCGYIISSDATEECPVCKTRKPNFQKV